MHAVVLGAGMVGSAIARDLSREPQWEVTAADASALTLAELQTRAPVRALQVDLTAQGAVAGAVHGADLVVCAVPGHMGYRTLKQVISAGKNVVDISFFVEDALSLHSLAQEHGVTAVVDCGVAPGLCNILAGRVHSLLDRTERYACYVGGLPAIRRWPYEYKAVFSPSDVIEEYTRPARLVERGQVVTRPALSEIELRDLPGLGTLEAFNTDGLRSLLHTLPIPWMVEKTLRYPGHAELMRVFRESGFFDAHPLTLPEGDVRPIDLTSRLLFQQWKLEPGEEDLTVMQVVIQGIRDGRPVTYTFDLLDRYDPEGDVSAMARTTGYTCALVARQVARGLFGRKGISPPEFVGAIPACYDDLLRGYAARGIHLQEQVSYADA